MKLSRKLIPAFAMLLVSAIMMTTASYAWFAINTSVDVQGMTVKTIAADSVLIADSTLAATNEADVAAFGTDLQQEVNATLAPVSTVDGNSFFYNTSKKHVGSDGKVLDDGDEGTTPYTAYALDAYKGHYGLTSDANAKGYADYVFQVKATNANSDAKNLVISDIKLNYSSVVDGEKAFRAAVFVQESNGFTDCTSSLEAATLKTILASADATYQDVEGDVSKAVGTAEALAAVNNLRKDAIIGSVTGNTTACYKVIVRLWLEGEDTRCTNETFASLSTGEFTLTLVVELGATAANTLNIAHAQ